jgi:Kef-type K+ transport system membrane component KefB
MIDALTDLAAIWAAVFIGIIIARITRLTTVLYFLALGCVMVNLGILPEAPEPFIRGLAELGIQHGFKYLQDGG